MCKRVLLNVNVGVVHVVGEFSGRFLFCQFLILHDHDTL
jgi:hypothetical protein